MAETALKSKIKKIPPGFLFSPAGMILFFLAIFFEILDLIIPGGSLTLEIIFDAILIIFLSFFAGLPFSSLFLSFLIERIPVISDLVPTWIFKIIGVF